MAGWFEKLMRNGYTGVVFAKHEARDTRYDAIVQTLRDREAEDRAARAKRQRLWYKQSLDIEPEDTGAVRLHKFCTNVPCRLTPSARALLAALRKQFPGGSVTFPHLPSGQQAVMLTRRAGAEPRQIGWIETVLETDYQGLLVDTDGTGTTLILRFCYAPTPVKMGEAGTAEVTEIRALDLPSAERSGAPRLVWVTRPEAEAMKSLRSRDYEAFYMRFKLELQAAIWSALSGVLAGRRGSRFHDGAYYTVVQQPDAATRRIQERTLDDRGHAADIGFNRTYDAAAATDILLLYLEGDILADVADIYFTVHSLRSAEAYFLKEEFFTIVRRSWAGAQSLTSSYGSDLATVLRMAQRAVPMPAQEPLLRQDWINLRQCLIDRFSQGGNAGQRPRFEPAAWPFASFPAGDVNLGLRLVYRQNGTAGTRLRGLGAQTETELGVETWPVEIQNVVLVAEKLPAPADIDLAWVRQHLATLATALLDESLREALDTIAQETHELRDRLYEHLRDNILHYQRMIWQQEDPQQRSMRYRKAGKKIALEWRFELGSEAPVTVDELGHRFGAPSIGAQFAAYSTGRDADLDQVIDPAAPLGHYANYAIFAMRPELRSYDLFSMLHFFKSLYVPENRQTAPIEAHREPEYEIVLESGSQMLLQPANRLVAHDGAERVLRLLAGAGADREHEPMIGTRDDQWLRPTPVTTERES